MQPDDLAVMELSSFQLEIMNRSPQVAAVLNITPNHLDRHASMDEYLEAKARILINQPTESWAILGRDDPGAWALTERVVGQLSSFGLNDLPAAQAGSYLRNQEIWVKSAWPSGKLDECFVMPRSEVLLRGEHNLLNVLAACAIAAASSLTVGAMRRAVKEFRGVSHRLEFVRTWRGSDWYTYRNSEVASSSAGYPVILFSHGWNGFNAHNTGQALQLASHGFIVVTVQHPYGAVVTVFDDGTIAKNNPAALPMDAPDEEYDIAADKLVDQWSGDLAYALDFMTEQNSDSSSPFFNKLDPERVGAYGHSTGGGAAIQFCGTDPRCQALLEQDPFMRPVSTEVLQGGVTQPAFFLFSQVWANDKDSLNNRQFKPFYASSKNAMGAVSIDGTTHFDFSDLPLLSQLAPQLGLKGPKYTRMRELESFLRRAVRDELDQAGLGLRLRYLLGGVSAATRLVQGKVVPERSGYYLGCRMTEALVEQQGLACALRAPAVAFEDAERDNLGIRSA